MFQDVQRNPWNTEYECKGKNTDEVVPETANKSPEACEKWCRKKTVELTTAGI